MVTFGIGIGYVALPIYIKTPLQSYTDTKTSTANTVTPLKLFEIITEMIHKRQIVIMPDVKTEDYIKFLETVKDNFKLLKFIYKLTSNRWNPIRTIYIAPDGKFPARIFLHPQTGKLFISARISASELSQFFAQK